LEEQAEQLRKHAVSGSFDVTSIKITENYCNNGVCLIGDFVIEGINEKREKVYENVKLECKCK
jgi:hypothetical protein